jgi:TusA-related sulfurtransferase
MEAFFSDVDNSIANETIPTLCHQSKGPFEVSVPCTPADLEIPKTLVLCKDDPIFTKDILTFVADKWGATVLEIESGHSPHLSETHRQWIANLVTAEAEKARDL